MSETTTFIEICNKDGLSIYECPHTYCDECGSTDDVCGFCLRCINHEGECEWKNDPEWVAPEQRETATEQRKRARA